MTATLESFAASCKELLEADPGPEGRKKVCALLESLLKNKDFVNAHLTNEMPERKLLYGDPELGFCILAHVYKGPKDSQPHDHGPSWAIYGQVSGETEMSDWQPVQPPSEGKPGKARKTRTYTLKPGMVHLYNEGDLHSPRRASATRLIRIEGKNMDNVRRLPYERVD